MNDTSGEMMTITAAELKRNLRIEFMPESWNDFFDDAMNCFDRNEMYWLEEKYITDLHNSYGLFSQFLEKIVSVAAKIRKMPDLMRYICLLKCALKDPKRYLNELNMLRFPVTEGKDSEPFDLAPLFAILSTVPDTVMHLEKRGVPETVISESLKEYEAYMRSSLLRYGKVYYNELYFEWSLLTVNGELLHISTLNFQKIEKLDCCVTILKDKENKLHILPSHVRLHKDGMVLGWKGYEDETDSFEADFVETDTYYEGYPIIDGKVSRERVRFMKSACSVVLSNGDAVISVHIPQNALLDEKHCQEAYTHARKIFKSCYPERKFKGFYCRSWLMDPQLTSLLNPSSKILKFQSRYLHFPGRTASGNDVFSFVFNTPFQKPVKQISELSEQTSLQRALKEYYMNGKYIYEYCGICMF